MQQIHRPKLDLISNQEQIPEPLSAFVAQLQTAIDTADAKLFNQSFAQDVLWGSPFGAVVSGYEQIHTIHLRMFANITPIAGASRYQVETFSQPSDDVIIAYIRRIAHLTEELKQPNQSEPKLGSAFDELALIMLIQREGQWWLAAAQHLPDRRDVYNQLSLNQTAPASWALV